MGEWQVAQGVAGDSRSGREADSPIESIHKPRNVLPI